MAPSDFDFKAHEQLQQHRHSLKFLTENTKSWVFNPIDLQMNITKL